MAKKYRVKYAFGTPEIYDALKRTGKLDEHTVYFISDENSEYGTFYRGAIKVGTSKASDLVFDKKVTVTLAKASNPNDDDLTIEIEAGTTLVAAINDIYKYIFEEADGLQEQLNTLTGNGEVQGSINDAIANAFLDRFANGTLYTQAQCNEKFLTKDALEKIEDLIKVFTNPDTGEIDEEVINTIVDAAQGIQEVVSNYYTKQEMNEILVSEDKNIIKTYDSSANFPVAESASKNVFYVDDEENIVYRWGLNEEGTAREYVEISGAGSGSGGDVKLETKIYVKGGKTTVSVAKGNNLVVDFVFSSAYTMIRYNKATKEFEKIQQQTGSTASVKYYLDGIQFDSGYISQSNYNETDDTKNTYNRLIVPASRLNATKHTLKITAEDVAGNSYDEIINVNVVSANITSSYVPTPISLDRELEIPVTVTSTSDAQLFYTIDGGDTIKVQDVPVGSPVIKITISPMLDNGVRRSHGYHNVKIWATTYIEESDTTISTRVLSYNVIWYDTENPLPIITTSLDIEENAEHKYDITQYNYAILTYQVYPASTVDLILKDVTTGIERIVNTLNVDTITKTWTYTFDAVGEYEMYINVHYGQDGADILASTKYDIVVSKSDISMDATPGSSVYFTAKNRSNSEANPAQWHSEIGNFDATLTGFLWNASSGWSSNGATTSLKVAGGARCVIPYKPFDRDKRTRGQVIEFDFSTSNLSDATATVISCYSESDNSGIEITATGAYFSSAEFGQTTDGDARIYVPFKENERIRLSFVITPMEEDEEGHGVNDDEAVISLWNGSSYSEVNTIREGWWKFVKIYLNGICVGIQNYSGSFQQSTPASIVIGSDSATVDIYSIRAYETVLYDRAIVNNFIADTQDPVEKLRLFKRNNILNEAGTDVEPSALRRLMPCLFVTCETDATVSGIINNEHILPTNKADKRGVTVFFDCDGLDDDAKKYYNFCHTFVAFNVQWAVQGTSSQYYPRRNWKGTFKTEKKFKEDYIATATSSKPTYIFVDAPWEESIKDGRDARAVYANKYKEQYNKKYQLKDFSAISDDDRTLDEISSIPAKKFCMKADFAESSGTHNTGFAKYVDFILKSMGYDYLTPPQKAQYNKTKNMKDVSFRTSVDGYPIAMFWRPTFEDDWEFYGKFNFNIDKGAESVFGFIDTKDGGLSSSDVNPMTGQPFVEFNEDYYDAASQEDRIAYEPPIECWEFTNNSTDLCKFRNVTPTSFTETSTDADGVTEVPAWLGSFEVRHPDNDNLIDLDYGTGLKKPTHWAAFSEWVSSTDRTGVHNYDKNLPIPTTWTGTYEELISGASDKEIFATYEGRLTEMIADHETEFDYNRRYILQPVVVDPGDGTISPDMSYDLYGHIVHWNSVDSQWYDSGKELDTWVDDGPYVEEESNVDYTKAYWISDSTEDNYKKVYKYNTGTNTWDNIANIDQYALESPVTYNTITYQYDTAEYRFAKFRVELPLHMSIPMTTAYYVLTEFFCCADQRAKNMMFASWGYEPGVSNVKAANTYPDEETAAAAGYKPVYKYEIGTIASASTPMVYAAPATGLCFNEIWPDGKKMEFYNASASEIDLAGYKLNGVDENNGARDEWVFPAGAKISAGGYYVITFKSTAIVNGPAYGLSAKKAWSFTLSNPSGTVIDTVSHDGHNLGTKSIGRTTDGADTWSEYDYPSIGDPNGSGSIIEVSAPTNICFNEIHANEVQADGKKYIELYNPTSEDVNIGGWTLKKGDNESNVENDKSVTFVQNTIIGAKSFFVVDCIKKSTTDNVLSSGISADRGFFLRLYDNNNILVAELNNAAKNLDETPRKELVNFKDSTRGFAALARVTDGGSVWARTSTATYGTANVITPADLSSIDGAPVAAAEILLTTAIELSGIARTEDGEAFYGVGDSGHVYRIAEDGTATEIAHVPASNDTGYGANFEGLTKDSDGYYYAIDENTREVYKFSTGMTSPTVIGTVQDMTEGSLNTYEGIAYYKDTKFFVGHQNNPVAFAVYDTSTGTTSSPVAVTEVSEIADLYYDGTYLWIVDSKTCNICKYFVSENKEVVSLELIEKYTASTLAGKNPEAIVAEEDFVWLGCDGNSENGNYLVKVTLKSEEGGEDAPSYDPGTIITDHIVINEINGTTKYVEFFNPTSNAISLAGYGMLKTDTDPFAISDWYTFPSDAVIPAGGYFNICCDKSQAGDDGLLHTLYGISLNPGKVFHIYLIKYTAGLDTTSADSIIRTGTVIDEVDNMTKPVTYDEKDKGWSYGRINDGSQNWAMFSIPTVASVTGPLTGSEYSNVNGEIAGQGGGGEGEQPGTIKTVLYWVPKDAEYIWYPIFYDNDTILSLDNTGHIKFNPNVESTDRVGTGYAYNGTESVLWLNFKDAYDAEIRSTYVTMRSKGGLTYANCMKYFNQGQCDQWPENVYNIDGKFKYVIPATKGYVDYSTQDPNTGKYGVTIRNSSYLYECQGSREEHRKWWLNNRFTYMDSRYFAVSYAEDYTTIRLYTPAIWEGVTPSSTFKLTPYADMYLRVMFGQIVSTVRAEKNKTYDIIPSDPDLRFNDTETIIYGASNILSFGDMTNKYAGSVAIDKASKITDIILGTSSPYYNENIVGKGLTIGAGNTTLKNIDVEGCTKLTEIVGLNQVNSIEKVDARRTGITTFNFSTTGANLNEIYYPNTIAEIKFVNMKNITYGNINIPNYSNLRSVWIENCPQLKTTSWNIINNILNTSGNVLSAARLVGFEWSITTPEAFATWSKLLTKKGYNASGIQEYDIPYLDGTVNIGGTVVVSTGYKSSIEAMFAEVGGLKVNVSEGNTVGLNGIKITPEQDILDFEGTAMIVPNKPYKFKASYLPDDFVLESEKGVTWNVPSQLTVIEQTSEYVILQYVGSTGGNNTYTMTATSKSDPLYAATISIRPSATLSRIKVTDTLGQEIGEDPIVIKEGETILLNVDFLPEGTDDTQITISAINGQHLTYTYDSMNKILTITGKEVDREQNCSLRLQSVTVPSVTRIIYLTVHNVVSRIFKLKNAAGDLIGGYINVDYIDAFTGEHITFGMPGSKFDSVTGVIQLRTDSSCGFGELKVEAHSYAAENGEKQYNQPATIVVPELATTATNDYEREFVFHDPITATITIKNAGAPVTDRVLRIDSLENESIRNLITPPYNRVLAGQEVGGEAVEVKLLANTEHHITITELDEHGNMIVSGGRYSQYSGIIKTGTADASYTITISRDYLGNIDDENELHMTILTGAAGSAYNTVRIYVRTADTITIDWGDKEDYGGSQDATQWTTVIDGTQYAFDKEIPVYHIYKVREKEYDITVSANTQRIRWFHVIPESATQMLPCIGTTSSAEGFHTNWQVSDTGGLVAYQSIGAAKFETLPTFRFANKTYSKLLSVGNVFKSCTTARTAESLFENSTVEQLYNGALFDNCTEIESFKNTFKNSNITILPSGFFMSNTKAKNFESTFENCTNLSSINSAENITFIRQDADVEVVSVLRMFAGCVNLTSEVPALWKTFYGCSFTSTPQKSFENCNKAVNFDNIPNDWGGQPNVSYIESEYKALRYFSTTNVPKSDTAEFITNIYPKGHYRYEYDIEFTADWYEMIPLFGAAIGTTDGINTTLESVIDFNRGGNAEGTSPGIYTAYMPYRINAAPDADWALALNLSTGNAGEVFGSSGGGTGYGNMGEHIIFDISYTTDGRVTVYPYGTNKENTQKQFRIADWDNGINWRATLPLKILNIYNTHELPYDAPSGESTTELYRGKYIKFYSLKIYDDSEYKSLIHEIVPVYGQVPNTNVMTAFLYDKMTDTPFICSTPDTSKLSYYAKND